MFHGNPLQATVPWPGALIGSLDGAEARSGGGSMLAGSGFIPLLIDGAGITLPGSTG